MSTSSPYKAAKSVDDFYAWIKAAELPQTDFDYVEVYKKIYDNFYELFGFVEEWESDFMNILSLNGADLSEFLFAKLSEEDKESLKDDYDWDGSQESLICTVLGDTRYAMEKEAGGQASAEFIKLFEGAHKRKVLDLFICSIAFNLRNNIGMSEMDSFLGYKVR